MKKTVVLLFSILAISAVAGGCSSSKKEVVETPAPAVSQSSHSPVDLGASSGGRGI